MKKTFALALLLAGSQALAADDGPRTFRPRFDPGPGTYTQAQRVRVWSPTAGSDIYCTTDGSTPTVASTRYTAPFTVSTTTAIRCVAKKWRRPVSYIGTASFIIQSTPSPVYLVGNATAVGRSESSSLLSVIEGVFFLAAAAGGGSSVAAVSLDISGAVAAFVGEAGGTSSNSAALSSTSLYTSPSQYYAAASSTCSSMAIRSTGSKVYVCDCQTGAQFGCVAGSDSNAGTDPAAPKQTWSAAIGAFNAMAAGGTVALCKGGAFSVLTSITARNANCSAAVDMTAANNTTTCDLRDYAPSWGGTARPKVNAAASGVTAFISGTNAWPTGNGSRGVRIMNLDFQGGGTGPGGTSYGQYAFWVFGNQGPYLLCNNNFERWGIGVNTQYYSQHTMQGMDVWGNTFIENTSQGALVYGGTGGSVSANYFDRNGSTTTYDHSLYVTAHVEATDFQIANNEFRYTGSTVCNGNVVVVHGASARLNIENNIIDGGTQPGNGCWGLSVDKGGYSEVEGFTDTTIRRNWILNVGNAGIATDSDAGTTIENNVLVLNKADTRGIYYTWRAHNTGDTTSTGTIIRNNTIYNNSTSVTNAYAIRGEVAEGSGRAISNNSIYYVNSGGKCFSLPGVVGDYTFVGNNACYNATWNTTFDPTTHVTTDPLYTSATTDFTPQSSSPLNSAGSNTYKATTDFNLATRPNPPSIGAIER